MHNRPVNVVDLVELVDSPYDQQVLEEFHNLIDSKELSIMNLGELLSVKVREIALK